VISIAIPYCRTRRDAPPITATPSLLPKRCRRIPTIVPLYRPVLRRHQLIVESSGPLVEVVVPPVALLPFVVIMPPVEVVVHSVALLPLAAVVPPVAVVYRPSPLSRRPSKLIVESSDVALLSLSLSSLVRHRPPPSYRAAAASLLIVEPPPPSVDFRDIRPTRRRRCAACCPAAPCHHHAARRSRCAFCRPAAPCRCRAARRHRVPPVTIVVPPIKVYCRVIGRCPPLFVAVVTRPPLPAALLSRRRCLSLNRRAAACGHSSLSECLPTPPIPLPLPLHWRPEYG
jgi:hypothetical protein